MSELIDERYMRFHALYVGVFNEAFDVDEFIADDLYAFRAFERALRSDNQKLRNLAAHLQVERQANMESITLTPHQALARTRRLKLLVNPDSGEDVTEELPPPPPMERVKGPGRPSPAEISLLTTFQAHFRRAFGNPLDLGKMMFNDEYGQHILKQALGSSDTEVVQAAKAYAAARAKRQLSTL
ncbi:MAG: hypothetical protein JWR50_4355 [Mucilaginibacter sp.]|nr:hypothetical protein [Mucilaginibacter sp.]